jgi:hypothetical protein
MSEPGTVIMETTAEIVAAQAKKPRAKRASVQRYPANLTVAVTEGMVQALARMTPAGGPFSQSTYTRLLLHRGLLQDDAIYRASFGGNGHA